MSEKYFHFIDEIIAFIESIFPDVFIRLIFVRSILPGCPYLAVVSSYFLFPHEMEEGK